MCPKGGSSWASPGQSRHSDPCQQRDNFAMETCPACPQEGGGNQGLHMTNAATLKRKREDLVEKRTSNDCSRRRVWNRNTAMVPWEQKNGLRSIVQRPERPQDLPAFRAASCSPSGNLWAEKRRQKSLSSQAVRGPLSPLNGCGVWCLSHTPCLPLVRQPVPTRLRSGEEGTIGADGRRGEQAALRHRARG